MFDTLQNTSEDRLDNLAVSKDVSSNIIELDPVELSKQSKRCVQKVVMEVKIEYEEVVECEHSYDKRCFTSLSTVFRPEQVSYPCLGNTEQGNMFQEEQCNDNYVKDCFIKYEKAAVNTTALVCKKPLVRDCGVDSSEEYCSTQYETECSTQERVHQVIPNFAVSSR